MEKKSKSKLKISLKVKRFFLLLFSIGIMGLSCGLFLLYGPYVKNELLKGIVDMHEKGNAHILVKGGDDVFIPKDKLKLGPGQYLHDNSYDWNKKSFNINFS